MGKIKQTGPAVLMSGVCVCVCVCVYACLLVCVCIRMCVCILCASLSCTVIILTFLPPLQMHTVQDIPFTIKSFITIVPDSIKLLT